MSKYNTFDAFIKAHLGKAMDYDGVAGCQCIDLCKYYLDELLGLKPGAWGDAYAWYTNFNNISVLKNNFTRIANTPSFIPKKGDIMVWGQGLSRWGHVAICTGEGTTSYFYSWDNNWTGNHDATAKIKHNYNNVLGVLRPKDQSKINPTSTSTTKPAESTSDSNYKLKNPVKGLDISVHQGANVDFNKIKKAGYDFVILQAGYGKYISQKDKYFESNYKKAKSAGLNVGAYWYSYAKTAADATAEAKVCLEVIKGKQFEYPIFYDVEDPSQSSLSKSTFDSICKNFLNSFKGYKVGLYSYTSFFNAHISESTQKAYDIWIAHYDVSKPAYKNPYTIWQYTSKGKVDGTTGNIDLDESYYDYPKMIKDAGLNGFTSSSSSKPADSITYSTYYVKNKNGAAYYDALNGKKLGTYPYATSIKIYPNLQYEGKDKKKYVKTNKGYYIEFKLLSTTKPATTSTPKFTYTVNKTYTLQVDLKVRTGPGTNYSQKNYKDLTADGKNHAYNQSKAVFKKGTKVTVLEVKNLDAKNIFIRCPSGWCMAVCNGEQYIK